MTVRSGLGVLLFEGGSSGITILGRSPDNVFRKAMIFVFSSAVNAMPSWLFLCRIVSKVVVDLTTPLL